MLERLEEEPPRFFLLNRNIKNISKQTKGSYLLQHDPGQSLQELSVLSHLEQRQASNVILLKRLPIRLKLTLEALHARYFREQHLYFEALMNVQQQLLNRNALKPQPQEAVERQTINHLELLERADLFCEVNDVLFVRLLQEGADLHGVL